jgi:hypothetical protein
VQIGIQITKSTAFRGVQQEFSNVYHFNLATAITAPAESLIDEVTNNEKSFHSTLVNFVRAQCWSSGGTEAQNQMLHQKDLSGTGATSPGSSMDPERAVLTRWPAGFDSRGRPVYLRKYYHVRGVIGGVSTDSSAFQNQSTKFTPAQKASIAGAVDAVSEIGGTESWDLRAESGRDRTGGPEAHDWLEHHQLGDMWR